MDQVKQIADTFGVDWPHLIAQTISFIIVCIFLYKFAYKRVLAMLEERRQRIAELRRLGADMNDDFHDTICHTDAGDNAHQDRVNRGVIYTIECLGTLLTRLSQLTELKSSVDLKADCPGR